MGYWLERLKSEEAKRKRTSETVMHPHGELLNPILWMGEQWAVTTYGLECKNGLYFVKRGKDFWYPGLTVIEVYTHWYRHLTEKTWVDKEDIENALHAMLILFNEKGKRTKVPAPYSDKQ